MPGIRDWVERALVSAATAASALERLPGEGYRAYEDWFYETTAPGQELIGDLVKAWYRGVADPVVGGLWAGLTEAKPPIQKDISALSPQQIYEGLQGGRSYLTPEENRTLLEWQRQQALEAPEWFRVAGRYYYDPFMWGNLLLGNVSHVLRIPDFSVPVLREMFEEERELSGRI